ncbi:hypothetical protein D0N50_07685 [Erwinia billingiae]|nr:hypothetical protein D0N50_07685 [Erwinia billingiae]
MTDPPTFFRRVIYIERLLILYFNITLMAGVAQFSARIIVISLVGLNVKVVVQAGTDFTSDRLIREDYSDRSKNYFESDKQNAAQVRDLACAEERSPRG